VIREYSREAICCAFSSLPPFQWLREHVIPNFSLNARLQFGN